MHFISFFFFFRFFSEIIKYLIVRIVLFTIIVIIVRAFCFSCLPLPYLGIFKAYRIGKNNTCTIRAVLGIQTENPIYSNLYRMNVE